MFQALSEAKRILEAVGDGGFELVTARNFEHLEVGNDYEYKAASDRGRTKFLGWVDERGNTTHSRSPEQVYLNFRDSHGDEWQAYHHKGK